MEQQEEVRGTARGGGKAGGEERMRSITKRGQGKDEEEEEDETKEEARMRRQRESAVRG